MPRIARFKIAAIDQLLQQLRFAPEQTRQRQMDAAEQLVSAIDPARTYPEDFIVYRITGYRPERSSSTMLVGQALLGDLANFVLRISRDLHIPAQHGQRAAQRIQDIAKQLNVSTKTIQRYRSQGLVCHYVYFDDRQLLACFDDALERFVAANTQRVKRAKVFSRTDDKLRQQIIQEARHLREAEGMSLNEAALQLAKHYGRAHETVRTMLRKHDRRACNPIFAEADPVSVRDASLLYRAWRRGVPVAVMAARFDKTPPTVHRAINRHRRSLLQEQQLHYVQLPTFALEDAAQVILSHRAVTTSLNDFLPGDDALQLIAAAREIEPLDEDAEQAMVAGFNFLKHRAASMIVSFDAWPGARELDRAETDLRWAHRLKCRLASSVMPAALGSIEQHLHRALETQPADVVLTCLNDAVDVLSQVIDTFDPTRGGRLARRVAYAVDRALAARQSSRRTDHLAAMVHREGTLRMSSIHHTLTPWAWLDEPRFNLRLVNRLKREARGLVIRRHGLDGSPPRTCAEIAKALDRTPSSIARRLAAAERQMRTMTQAQVR